MRLNKIKRTFSKALNSCTIYLYKMAITEEELKELIKEPNVDIEKVTTLSSDGKNLLTRLPKEIVEHIKIKKGDKIRWLVKPKSKEIMLEVINV